MKLFNYLFLITTMALIIACGDSKTDQADGDSVAEDSNQIEGMEKIYLSEYQLQAMISIPDDSKGKAQVTTTDWGSIVIRISDWYGIEIVPFGMSISDKKVELEADLVYSVEYLTEEENLIIYKKTISNSEVDPEFHFFMNKEINGDLIEVRSNEDATFTKSQVEKMVLSAKTLKAES